MTAHSDAIEDLRDRLEELASEARDLLPDLPDDTRARAKAYWFPQLLQAIGGENEYCGSSQHSLEDSIQELREAGGPDDEPHYFECPACGFDDEEPAPCPNGCTTRLQRRTGTPDDQPAPAGRNEG
jgi:hypothetical protein